jgi:hypothetical protein
MVDINHSADVAGFFYQEQESAYTPSPELITFLSEGPPPIYVKSVHPLYTYSYT